MPMPLEGIRILDLSQVYAGPACTRILCDLGAEVIKVESASRLDVTRALLIDGVEPPEDYWNHAGYFLVRNAGKKGITVDLTKPDGPGVLRRLLTAGKIDVFVENFTPRVMRACGLDYPSVREVRPDIIMVSLTGYGQDGPWSDYVAYGMGLEPASGISQLTGYRDGPPIRSGISLTDPFAGMMAAGAIMLALRHRARTGRGQCIDLSEHEAAIPMAAHALMDRVMNQRTWPRVGNASRWYAPQGCYRCRGEDDWVVLACRTDEEWAALCRALGHEEWQADGRFADAQSRLRHQPALDELIGAWTKDRRQEEAVSHLQRAGVPAAPVLNGKQMLMHPHVRARRLFDTVDQPGWGRRPVPRHFPVKFSRFEAAARGPAPRLGEHNASVFREVAGMTPEEIARLEADGVSATDPVLAAPLDAMRSAVRQPNEAMRDAGQILRIEPEPLKELGLD